MPYLLHSEIRIHLMQIGVVIEPSQGHLHSTLQRDLYHIMRYKHIVQTINYLMPINWLTPDGFIEYLEIRIHTLPKGNKYLNVYTFRNNNFARKYKSMGR